MSDEKNKTEDEARERIAQIEVRLGGLFDAVSDGFREMTERIRPLAEAGQVHMERRVRVGGVAEFIDSLNPSPRPVPEHEIRQTAEAWTLEATLPGVTLPQIHIDLSGGRLLLETPKHRLTCSVPEDLDEEAMEMAFRAGALTLTIPRRAEET